MAIENIKRDFGGGGVKRKPQKDTSVFGGRSSANAEQMRGWMKTHANEVFSITKGRVPQSKIPEYERKLASSKWGPLIEKYKHEPERMGLEMRKALDKAKTDKERFDIKEDIEVAKRMYGLGKK